MNRLLDKYLFSFPRNAAGGAGDGAGDGGAAGAGAGAGAGASGGAGAGAGASAGASSGAAGAASGGGGQGAGQGSGDQPWYSTHNFDADTVAWIEERKLPDLATAMRTGREGSRLARDRNVMPKPDLKAVNDWAGWQDLGWSPERDKYNVEKPKLEKGDVLDDAEFSEFVGIAHELKIPPSQASALFAKMNQRSNKMLRETASAGAAARKKLSDELRQSWGADYDTNVALARRAAAYLDPDLTVSEIDALVGGPRTLKMMHKFGAEMGEDKLVTSQGSGVGGTETVAGLQAQLNSLLADPDFKKAFNDPRHPRHQDVKAQRMNLMERKAKLEIKASGRAM